MAADANQERILPFGDLPQSVPPQVPLSQPRKRKPSKITKLINECDWKAYEENVLEVVRQAIDRLPREEEVWLGVSSPRDWYDYVTKV